MKFGVRECVDVMFKAKTARKIGSRQFFKNEPVLLFDTLTTSTLEGSGTTVYAQGGRGNARLMSWDGDRAVTFTMTDALMSKEGLAILASAELIDASASTPIYQHMVERVSGNEVAYADNTLTVTLSETPAGDTANDGGYSIYVMLTDDNGDMIAEPYIAKKGTGTTITVASFTGYTVGTNHGNTLAAGINVLVDYYVARASGAYQVEIRPESFGGNFYIEGSTLFRDQLTGKDMPAEIIIPNGRIQSNFSFTMAGTGDPSTFDFTIDAFPDFTRWDRENKVLADIQVIENAGGNTEATRTATQQVTELELNYKQLNMVAGDAVTITAKVNGTATTITSVAQPSDSTLVTISGAKVTAGESAGETVLTVTAGNYTAKLPVTVVAAAG